jgi:hypothetical protein
LSFDSSDEKNNIERSIFNMKQWFDMRDFVQSSRKSNYLYSLLNMFCFIAFVPWKIDPGICCEIDATINTLFSPSDYRIIIDTKYFFSSLLDDICIPILT